MLARFFVVVVALMSSVLSLRAAELNKIPRKIARQPAYESKEPKYCLLVFGAEMKTRVWLVLDKNALYVDRNGNGDLTEKGKRVSLPGFRKDGHVQYSRERYIDAGDIFDGQLKHTGLQVTEFRIRRDLVPKSPDEEDLKAIASKDPDAPLFLVRIDIDYQSRPEDKLQISGRVTQSAFQDATGFLQFASSPEEAPIIRFNGPFQMGLLCKQVLSRGNDAVDLKTVIGTPGLGAGSFASVFYGGLISSEVNPVADLEFSHRDGFHSPIKSRVVLKHRC